MNHPKERIPILSGGKCEISVICERCVPGLGRLDLDELGPILWCREILEGYQELIRADPEDGDRGVGFVAGRTRHRFGLFQIGLVLSQGSVAFS